MNSTIGRLDAPKHPNSIPLDAKWLSGQGLGGWFHLEKIKDSDNYRMRRFSPNGKLECDREFKQTSNTSFDIKKTFDFTHISHCAKCLTIQNNQIHTFEYIELIN